MTLVLAVVLGFFFGFVLQKSGAANPTMIVDMLRFKNLHLMKAILLGIGLSSGTLFILLYHGAFQVESHLDVRAAYVGVAVGGLLLGAGWGLAGFCPGTAVVGLGAGRKDAFVFILGGLLGTWLFMLSYGTLKSTFLFADLGGKATLAQTGNASFPALITNHSGLAVGGGIAIAFVFLGLLLPLLRARVDD